MPENHEVLTKPTDTHPLQNIYNSENTDLIVNNQNTLETSAKYFHKWASIRFKHSN